MQIKGVIWLLLVPGLLAQALAADPLVFQLSGNIEKLANTNITHWFNQFGNGRTRFIIKGLAGESPSYQLETIQPLSDIEDDDTQLLFLQAALLSTQNHGSRRPTLNLGIGQRYLVEDEQAVAGVNLFLDYEANSSHKRASLGLEYQRHHFSAALNYYQALSNQKIIDGYIEQVLSGHELNLSGQLPYLPWARIKASQYHWDQQQSEDIQGKRLGLALQLSSALSLELGQQRESQSQPQNYAELSLEWPAQEQRTPELSLSASMFAPSDNMQLSALDWVERDHKIRIEKTLVNQAPVFDSSASASVMENQLSAIRLSAVDEQSVTYAITGGSAQGDDSALFAVDDATGVVSFKQAPDYENPLDADGNNIYHFRVAATDTQGLASTQAISITVLDVDEQGVSVSPTVLSVIEGNMTSYRVWLNTQPSADVSIVMSNNNTIEVGLTLSTLSFTPDNWSDPQVVGVLGLDDANNKNGVATISHVVSGGDYEGLSADEVIVNTIDLDLANALISNVSGSTSEAGGVATFSIQLETQPSADVVVDLSSSDIGEGVVSPAQVIFTPDTWNDNKIITITGVDDDIDDGDIGYTIAVVFNSQDVDYHQRHNVDLSVINTDNDTAELIVNRIDGFTGEDGDSGSLEVKLTTEPVAAVVLAISSDDISEGVVTPDNLNFDITNWNIWQSITISGVDDSIDDGDINYQVLIDPSASIDAKYQILGVHTESMLNRDNDATPGVTVTETSGNTDEDGGFFTFGVRLNTVPIADVVINLSSSDTSEGLVAPIQLTFTPSNWQNTQTVRVDGVDDSIVDGDQAYSIVTSNTISTDPIYMGLVVADVAMVNADNDVVATIGPVSGDTSESGASVQFSIVLTAQPSSEVTIPLSSSDASEGEVSPSLVVFDTFNWNIPQTITINGIDDGIADGDQPYYIIIEPMISSDPIFSGADPEDVLVFNRDND